MREEREMALHLRRIWSISMVALFLIASYESYGEPFFVPPQSPKIALLTLPSPGLSRKLTQREPNAAAQVSVWLFFTDKGITNRAEYEKARRAWEAGRSPRVLRRRAKVLPYGRGTVCRVSADFRDLPVLPKYINAVKACGLKVRVVSRWFNGVSVQATAKQIAEVEKLPFVRSIAPVARFRRTVPKETEWSKVQRLDSGNPANLGNRSAERSRRSLGNLGHRRQWGGETGGGLDYGASYTQLAMMNVPPLHDAGWDGSGVRICLLDSGFDTRDHEVFQRINIVGQWDFVDGDEDASDGIHGMWVLSVIGGYKEGALIGPAYGAEYLLARTEDISSETPVEEDYWIAGVEWADSMGADVVSSSVGYNIWDEGTGESYTYEDLDGNTARITIAADLAAERGITVINAVGNEGDIAWHYALFPADGEQVIAVGSVNLDGSPTPFSSRGPTADGRIKPDVAAPGVDIRVASFDGPNPIYVSFRGTSFSAPLTAGVAALLLQAHPEWGPMEVREALRRSGSHALNPNNAVGWGLINAETALDAEHTIYGRVVDADSGLPLPRATVAISSETFGDSATTSRSGRFLFRKVPEDTYTMVVDAPRYGSARTEDLSIPNDWLEGYEGELHRAFEVGDLVYNFPNPFGMEGTRISFPLRETGEVRVRVFTPSGELVWEEYTQGEKNQRQDVPWNGRNWEGEPVGTGIYLYVIEGSGIAVQGKMSLVR